MSIAVCYLARGADGGLVSFKAFIDSYVLHPASHEHTLYILAKGWKTDADEMRLIATNLNAQVIDLPDDGFDWGAYFRALPYLNEDYVCFLNTHSRINKESWLALLMRHAEKTEVGLTGCTANWRTMARTAFSILPISSDFIQRKGLGYGIFYFFKAWMLLIVTYPRHVFYPRFPNPHLRSNAFIIRKSLFVEFASLNKIPATKHDALILENSRKGLTRFIEKKGLKAIVVNNSGTAFDKEFFPESMSFFSPTQEEARIISDNQTRFYKESDIWQRRISEILSWGRVMSALKIDIEDNMRCPYCKSQTEHYLDGKDYNREISNIIFTMRRCLQCELLFVANPPLDIGSYYKSDYYPFPKSVAEFNEQRKQKQENIDILLSYKKSGKLLEVGPSVGYFLSLAKDAGFDVNGIEMDANCVSWLNNTLNIPTVQSDNPAAILMDDDTLYDVICLWHSIEHMLKPWEIIEQASKRLKPEGILLVAAPNPLSDQAKIMGKYWPHHDLPRHLSGVSMPWLKTLSLKLGLSTILETTRDKTDLKLNKVSWAMVFKRLAKHLPNKVQALFYYIGYGFSYLFLSWDNIELHGSCYVMIFQKPKVKSLIP